MHACVRTQPFEEWHLCMRMRDAPVLLQAPEPSLASPVRVAWPSPCQSQALMEASLIDCGKPWLACKPSQSGRNKPLQRPALALASAR